MNVYQKIVEYAGVVAVSATVSILATTLILDARYAAVMEAARPPSLPSASVGQVEDEIARLPALIALDVESGDYQLVSGADVPAGSLIVFSDFRCSYCAAAMESYAPFASQAGLERVYFVESAILGPDSVSLAQQSMAALLAEPRAYERADYFSRLVDQPLAPSNPAVAIIEAHLQLSERLGVVATPTYHFQGSFHFGLPEL